VRVVAVEAVPVSNIVPAKKANHQANIVAVETILPHPDPETINLELIHIGDFQVVVQKGQFERGQLAVYIQPDSVVPQTDPFRFIWAPYANDTPVEVSTTDRQRRITVRKFRGQWSEGLLLPVTEFDELLDSQLTLNVTITEGDDVSELLQITHYDPDAGKEEPENKAFAPKRRYPKSLKGWLHYIWHRVWRRGNLNAGFRQEMSLNIPVYDVDALKNYGDAFQDGEVCFWTEKIHGSNARYIFFNGIMYAGSRTLWKAPNSPCIWRKVLKVNPWIEQWCRAHEGYTLYGEVVPTQKGFDYGCKQGEVKFFLFDILSPERKFLSYEEDRYGVGSDISYYNRVPLLRVGPYHATVNDSLVAGKTLVRGAEHIREGVVIKPLTERHVHGLGRLSLKCVSNEFLAKDSKR
jgi:hypothetical protein